MNRSSVLAELAHGDEVASGATDLHRRGESRATALAALRAAARGEALQAAALIAEVERASPRHGDAFDRALAHVARATLLGIDGQMPSARAELALALRVAAAGGIDTELVTDLVRGLGDVVVVTGPDRRQMSSAAAISWARDAVVIDARSHEVTTRASVHSLKRRPVVRGLLYALARHPARVIDKKTLAEAAWGCPYDPQRHHNPLKANVLHLRGLLAGSGLMIACGNPGYRLDAFAPFVFVVPFDLLGGPWQLDHTAVAAEPCTRIEHGAVIDGVRHEIRLGARRISLRARPVSRQLLYALASASSHYLARNAIAHVLWGTEYDPLRHECTLKSNIRRLRNLLAGFAELSSERDGYRMLLPDRVEFIPPVTTGQPPAGS